MPLSPPQRLPGFFQGGIEEQANKYVGRLEEKGERAGLSGKVEGNFFPSHDSPRAPLFLSLEAIVEKRELVTPEQEGMAVNTCAFREI